MSAWSLSTVLDQWALSSRLSPRRVVSRYSLRWDGGGIGCARTVRRCHPLHLPGICPSHSRRVGAFVSAAPRLGAADRRHARLRQSRLSLLLGVFSSRALRRPVGFDRGFDLELFEHKARQAAGSAINRDLSALRPQIRGNNADQRLSFLLRLHWLWHSLETEAGPLLRVLQLRLSSLSARSDRDCMLFVKSR